MTRFEASRNNRLQTFEGSVAHAAHAIQELDELPKR